GGALAADGRGNEELLVRWWQLAAWLPVRPVGAPDADPAAWPEGAPAASRTALAERMRLLPYLDTQGELAVSGGTPVARPVWWHSPGDRLSRECEDAFAVGDAFLVAPVLEPGCVERRLRLPHGWWYDVATGVAHRGPGRLVVPVVRDRLPVFVRAGAVVPVSDGGGGVVLEVWRPRAGRTGSGALYVPGSGRSGASADVVRLVSRLSGGEVMVTREDGEAVEWPVRVRGEAW
ncbi:TIM-barrel domain-containing protein, partial [Streptomyces alkaliterrae]